MTRRTYSDEVKAATLATLEMNEGNVKRTVRDVADLYAMNIPESTVRAWNRGRGVRAVPGALVRLKKTDIIAGLEKVLGIVLEAASDERKAQATGFKDLMTSAGIIVDKLLLLRGEATEISESRTGKTIRIDWGDGTTD